MWDVAIAVVGLALPCALLGAVISVAIGLTFRKASTPSFGGLAPAAKARGLTRQGEGWLGTVDGYVVKVTPEPTDQVQVVVRVQAPGVRVMPGVASSGSATGDPAFDANWRLTGAESRPDFAHNGLRTAWKQLADLGSPTLQNNELSCILPVNTSLLLEPLDAMLRVATAIQTHMALEDMALTDPIPGVRIHALHRLSDVEDVDAPAVASNLRHDLDLSVRIAAWTVLEDLPSLQETVRTALDPNDVAAATHGLPKPHHLDAVRMLIERFGLSTTLLAKAARLDHAAMLIPTVCEALNTEDGQPDDVARLLDMLLAHPTPEGLAHVVRRLPSQPEERRGWLLHQVIQHGSTQLVPELRAIENQMGDGLVIQAIRTLQSSNLGDVGGLSLTEDKAGGLSIVDPK